MAYNPDISTVALSPIDGMLPRTFRLRDVNRETPDTFTFHLGPEEDSMRFAFFPGQFNMLYAFGVGEVPISICGDPLIQDTVTHTIRVVGAVTKAMNKLQPGDPVGVRGPFGRGWPMSETAGRDVVLIAGGIGLAPLRSVIYEMLNRRNQISRLVVLYGTRTAEDILYREELNEWSDDSRLEMFTTVDRATAGWRGRVGVVTQLIPRAPFNSHNAVIMICGPEIMMHYTILELQSRGVPEDKIFVSLERNMKCAIGFCGHCQYGPEFICKDGPVFSYAQVKRFFETQEI